MEKKSDVAPTGAVPEGGDADYRVEQHPSHPSHDEEKNEKGKIISEEDEVSLDVRKEDHFGEAVVLDNANDVLTHVLHLDDDPTASPWTPRAMIIGTFPI